MKTNRLGCLSINALMTSLVTLLVLGGISLWSGSQMFSPGSLNARAGKILGGVTSHAEIGYACARCHPAPWSRDRMTDRCLVCHIGTIQEINDSQRLHSRLYRINPFLACQSCHPEHRGPDSLLTLIDDPDFPHDLLGFSLASHTSIRWANKKIQCQDCHLQETWNFDQKLCSDCHQNVDLVYTQSHSLSFGQDCLACHDGLETLGKNFDHNSTQFMLTGKHTQLLCTNCHLDARSLKDLSSTPIDCAICHRMDEPHAGQFGDRCEACHTTAGWSPATFDHSLSRFPLTGKHGELACSDCHQSNVFSGQPAECSACHAEPAFHAGVFGFICTDCHNTTAWIPARFDRAHSFPITHGEAVSCRDCHNDSLSAWTCYSCHDQNEMRSEHVKEDIFDFSNCLRCHPTGQKKEGESGD